MGLRLIFSTWETVGYAAVVAVGVSLLSIGLALLALRRLRRRRGSHEERVSALVRELDLRMRQLGEDLSEELERTKEESRRSRYLGELAWTIELEEVMRRTRQGSSGCPLQGDPRRARRVGRSGSPAGPLEVRRQEVVAVPRRAGAPVRTLDLDPVYNSRLVTQLVNRLMVDGKKSTAERVVYRALDRVGERTGRSPVEVLEQAIKTVTPVLEVKSRRVGGANYQVPVEVPQRRGRTLAVRWLVTYSRERREKHMDEKLAGEILDALEQQGGSFKKKDDMYRMAQANKAFAHYRW